MKTENGEETVDLSHRRVLVTGGGSGLGRVLAVEFANTGAEVHVCGRRREPLDELASGRKNVFAHKLDVADEDGTEAMFDSIGPVEILIANAGVAEQKNATVRTLTMSAHRPIGRNLFIAAPTQYKWNQKIT